MLSIQGISQYPGLYDAYFNDHLAFKNPLVAFVKLADIRVFGEVSSDAVLMGKDGWMFYKLKGEIGRQSGGLPGDESLSSGTAGAVCRFPAVGGQPSW